MKRRQVSAPGRIRGSDGRTYMQVLVPVTEAPRRGRLGCIWIPLLILLAVLALAAVRQSGASGLAGAAGPGLIGEATLQPTGAPPSPTPLDNSAETARALVRRIGLAWSTARRSGDLSLLRRDATGELYTYEARYVDGLRRNRLSEAWERGEVWVHAFDLAGAAPFICTTEDWLVTTTGADGAVHTSEPHRQHNRYRLTIIDGAAKALMIEELAAPCVR